MMHLYPPVVALLLSLLVLTTCVSQNRSVRPPAGKGEAGASDKEAVFPLNDYLTTAGGLPYPVLVSEKIKNINTASFVNVMNFGAKGDGVQVEDEAIAKAFEACKDGSGVVFPSGKTFLIHNLIRIPLTKNITVSAYGATFTMDKNTGYNAIAFEAGTSGYQHQLIWLGGTFDGNKNNQSWPGSPTGNNSWTVTEPNYGLLTVRSATFALIKDLSLVNTVYDGVNVFECELGVFADCKAENGVELKYSEVRDEYKQGRQATYFKCTRQNSQVVYFLNLDCKGGSIGAHYSTNVVNDQSLAVVSHCRFYNQSQDAVHFESCKKVFLYQCTIGADNVTSYEARLHISNSCALASIKDCVFTNARVTFRNASNLQAGIIDNCRFESNDNASPLRNFVQNATHVVNCTFSGKTSEEQVAAKYISGSSFQKFEVAADAGKLISRSTFRNGVTPIKKLKGDVVISDCKFENISNPAFAARMQNSDRLSKAAVRDMIASAITILDQRRKMLGRISTDAEP